MSVDWSWGAVPETGAVLPPMLNTKTPFVRDREWTRGALWAPDILVQLNQLGLPFDISRHPTTTRAGVAADNLSEISEKFYIHTENMLFFTGTGMLLKINNTDKDDGNDTFHENITIISSIFRPTLDDPFINRVLNLIFLWDINESECGAMVATVSAYHAASPGSNPGN